MTAATIFREFNHLAIASNLSGRQMQLWLKVYECLNSYRRQDVQLYTPMLLDALQISASQFRRARQGLIDAGFLSIRQDSQQHTSYTLLLQGKAVSFVAGKSCGTGAAQKNASVCGTSETPSPTGAIDATGKPCGMESAKKNAPDRPPQTTIIREIAEARAPRPYAQAEFSRPLYPSGDIMLNGGYQAELQAFFRQHPDSALNGWLQQWADMRRKNGWTLTRWGMQTLLDKLKTLAGGNLQTMAAIVRQSVSRRWKGFYPLKAERKPSGEKLRRMEEQQRRNQPVHQKFQNEQRDLSFLER